MESLSNFGMGVSLERDVVRPAAGVVVQLGRAAGLELVGARGVVEARRLCAFVFRLVALRVRDRRTDIVRVLYPDVPVVQQPRAIRMIGARVVSELGDRFGRRGDAAVTVVVERVHLLPFSLAFF